MFGQLLEALYRSLSEPESLGEFLNQACMATRSHVGAIQTHDIVKARGTLPTAVGISIEEVAHYNERYAEHNILIQRSEPILATGAVVVGDDFVPTRELHDSVYWREYLKFIDVDHVAGICGFRDEDDIALLSFLRSRRCSGYDQAERAWMQRIAPHWVNVCRIRKQLGTLHETVVCLEAALDRVILAVFFVDARSQVCRSNHAAERLVGGAGVLGMRDGKLIARNPFDNQRLQRALEAARADLSHTNSAPGVSTRIMLHDAVGVPSAFASIHPLSVRAGNSGAGASAQTAVFVRSLFADSPEMLTEALGETFGLTPSEARLANALYLSNDLSEAAHAVGIGINTARSRLKLVFDKTGAHGQAALVKLLRELRSVLSDTSGANLP
jgi:DNA-binding CsgD family transcriptional regulator